MIAGIVIGIVLTVVAIVAMCVIYSFTDEEPPPVTASAITGLLTELQAERDLYRTTAETLANMVSATTKVDKPRPRPYIFTGEVPTGD